MINETKEKYSELMLKSEAWSRAVKEGNMVEVIASSDNPASVRLNAAKRFMPYSCPIVPKLALQWEWSPATPWCPAKRGIEELRAAERERKACCRLKNKKARHWSRAIYQQLVIMRRRYPYNFVLLRFVFPLQLLLQSVTDKIPEDFCLKRGNTVTQKNKDIHVVIHTLPLLSLVSVSAIVCTVFFPQ